MEAIDGREQATGVDRGLFKPTSFEFHLGINFGIFLKKKDFPNFLKGQERKFGLMPYYWQ